MAKAEDDMPNPKRVGLGKHKKVGGVMAGCSRAVGMLMLFPAKRGLPSVPPHTFSYPLEVRVLLGELLHSSDDGRGGRGGQDDPEQAEG